MTAVVKPRLPNVRRSMSGPLPRNPTGKILERELRGPAGAEVRRAAGGVVRGE
ncbi:hypothetical protein [Streptomyces sp. NPDC058092]|uniref:hypothetical protein n=1 Tax=Streptomyces sp. NPDC058092 TaxID=3346336 RepID=UPI0036ECDADF